MYNWHGATRDSCADSLLPHTGGLPCPSIREDRDGALWFGTTAGVYHYDGKRFINFSRSDPRLPVVRGEH